MKSGAPSVIVIGGGHAGVEAAWAAANLLGEPRSVALVTLDPAKIGVMSCNPAIGGLAKGQLVREIDAMGGLMGLAADASGIQFKILNRSKGPAVHGPRAQCDKHAYARAVQDLIASRVEIEVVAGSVERLIVEAGEVRGVVVRPSSAGQGGEGSITLGARAVVLTTGTFMRGLMHTGSTRTAGGRFGEGPAVGISSALRELGFELGRLKTGTPPRLRRGSIRWEDLEPSLGDDPPIAFSDLSAAAGEGRRPASELGGSGCPGAALGAAPSRVMFPCLPQVDCRQTRTTAAAHELIRANLHRAPMYTGQIESVGPRYCPSIEDKVVRFAERESHAVLLEPEAVGSGRDEWIYCNGISTSLPADVQDRLVRSMPGCEGAEILRHGYAVEYDMVRPHQIMPTGMTRLVAGLHLAGQINGTSGYEEAAAQGLVAGVNAARWARGRGEFVLGRATSYIGVLMDDLVTKTPVEPYRMFTSRAEHRLMLRSDNAADRLTPIADELGLLGTTPLGRLRREAFARRQRVRSALEASIDAARVGAAPLAEWLRRPDFGPEDLRRALADRGLLPEGADTGWGRAALATAHTERFYEAYLRRHAAESRRASELESRRIPEGLGEDEVRHLRAEARAALKRYRPRTIGQAGRLEGFTPADTVLLGVIVRKHALAARGG
ncbi:MAG: tRNA uridine-5-carboxymethylaminomethyl(34) synthesis enzyme MnmG [Phycisphaerae bacterium]|nr:tRNA uridine-5-carboxymethylaminomethyl(34) synthesis enzyme MnmG [Phycisphaerae bacterium]